MSHCFAHSSRPTDLLGTELIKKLLSSTCVLLSSKSREVVRATLEFIKVTIGVLPPSELVPHVEDMVSQAVWSTGSTGHVYVYLHVCVHAVYLMLVIWQKVINSYNSCYVAFIMYSCLSVSAGCCLVVIGHLYPELEREHSEPLQTQGSRHS